MISVFISYASQEKHIAGSFASCLKKYCGFQTFLAHEDIRPSAEWEFEIHKALRDTDFFIPLISEAFKASDFTDQETGIAISLDAKIIPVKLERVNPYGFINKYQALQYKVFEHGDNSKQLALTIAQIGLSYKEYHYETIGSLLSAFKNCSSFETANAIIEVLTLYDQFTSMHLAIIKRSIKTNRQIRGAWGLPAFKKFLHDKYEFSIDD